MIKDEKIVDSITRDSLFKLIIKMAIPSAIAMLVIIIYGITDTYFISKIGVTEIAAVGIAFSFMSVIQAFGLLYGHGSGNYIARMQGRRFIKESEEMVSISLLISFLTGLGILFFCSIFINVLIDFLGAKNEIVYPTKSYLSILLLSAPFSISSLTMNNQLRLQGKPKWGALALILGAIINCIFDPIFIFVLGFGIEGAAYATLLGQVMSFVILTYYTIFKNDIKIKCNSIKINKKLCYELYVGGFPNFSREIFIAISIIILNNILSIYGKSYVAAFALVYKIIQASTYIMVGIGHGFQPICAINYGAKLYQRVIKSFYLTLSVSVGIVIIFESFFILKGELIIKIFTTDTEVLYIAKSILAIQAFTLPAIAYITISGMFLQNTHQFKNATLLTTARQGTIYIPIIYFLNYMYDIKGIFFTQPVTDIITLIIAIYLVRKNTKRLKIIEG